MIQFTEAERMHLKEKGRRKPEIAKRLKDDVKEIFLESILVPTEGIGNWTLYYYCPKCSVELDFDRYDRFHHKCTTCGRIYTGEPYDSTWWGLVNSKNYTAAFQMGLLYIVTEEAAYAKKAVDIMLEYSRHYKDYKVHGNIPYNGPGKAGAQTLDEANFLRSFAMTYDLLSDTMTEEERAHVRDGMLLPGAEFLMEHRHNQLHNHEVIINSAIAIIGLIFHMESYVQFAVYEPYGILYQLEKGVLPNHMWFEGAFGYHFYALTSFFAYEKFALHTEHSHISHPDYKKMMELLVSYLEPEFRIPMLNDTNYGHTRSSLYLYEFAYREIGGEKLAYILNRLYEQESRDNLEAFIYGVEELPESKLELINYHSRMNEPGHTILRGKNDRYLLFKHDGYGGEHDHYDRLSLDYIAYGKRISPDIGTTGYGALLHYDYYKNTGSHNTVNLGGENQSPANAILTRYEEIDGVTYVDALVDWQKPYQMPDSFTIVQWNETYYKTVSMIRKIAWTDNYFAEIFVVEGVMEGVPTDWVMHFSGKIISPKEGDSIDQFADKKPYKYLHNMKQIKQTTTTVYDDGGIKTCVYGWDRGQAIFVGNGPDNPSVTDMNYRVERSWGRKAVFGHVIESSDGDMKINDVFFEELDNCVYVTVGKADGEKQKLVFTV